MSRKTKAAPCVGSSLKETNPLYIDKDTDFCDNLQPVTAENLTAESLQRIKIDERRHGRILFRENPGKLYSRLDVCNALALSMNHVKRIVYDLIGEGIVEVSGKAISSVLPSGADTPINTEKRRG